MFGNALGGKCEQMKDIDPRRKKILGREHIQLTDAFFEMPYVQKYMRDKGIASREDFPPLVL